MFRYAQTNIQLYAQLQLKGYDDAKLKRVADAYGLAMGLFAARFRCSGKPFLAHLVGTSSILAAHGADVATVVAGLVHAAYEQGEFGTARPGMTEPKRERVRRAIGSEAESLVAQYSRLDWRSWCDRRDTAQVPGLPRQEREALFIRVANELEESLDLSLLYCDPTKRQSVVSGLQAGPGIAQALGRPQLAEEVAESDRLTRISRIPDCLVSARSASFTLDPLSLRQRLKLSVVSRLLRLRDALGGT